MTRKEELQKELGELKVQLANINLRISGSYTDIQNEDNPEVMARIRGFQEDRITVESEIKVLKEEIKRIDHESSSGGNS